MDWEYHHRRYLAQYCRYLEVPNHWPGGKPSLQDNRGCCRWSHRGKVYIAVAYLPDHRAPDWQNRYATYPGFVGTHSRSLYYRAIMELPRWFHQLQSTHLTSIQQPIQYSTQHSRWQGRRRPRHPAPRGSHYYTGFSHQDQSASWAGQRCY